MFEVGTLSFGALLGVVVVALLGHALTVRREKSKTLRQAASNFRDAFVVARKRIEAGEHEVTVIADLFSAHEDARLGSVSV